MFRYHCRHCWTVCDRTPNRTRQARPSRQRRAPAEPAPARHGAGADALPGLGVVLAQAAREVEDTRTARLRTGLDIAAKEARVARGTEPTDEALHIALGLVGLRQILDNRLLDLGIVLFAFQDCLRERRVPERSISGFRRAFLIGGHADLLIPL